MRSRWAESAGVATLVKLPGNRIISGQFPMGFYLPIRFNLDFFRRENAGFRNLPRPIVSGIERAVGVAVVYGLEGVGPGRKPG